MPAPLPPTSIRRRHDPYIERRRMRSLDISASTSSSIHGRLNPERRLSTRVTEWRDSTNEAPVFGDEHSSSQGDQDDQDLHEQGLDPHILADVRKALQYKTKVEERLKADSHVDADGLSHPSYSPSSSSYTGSPALPSRLLLDFGTGNQELRSVDVVDFRPATGIGPLHPVPSSSNDGYTLDWSGDASEDDKRDRRWPLSLSRKNPKTRPLSISRKVVVEKQESIYADKVMRIKSKATLQTLRKAEITRDQLERRYSALFPPHQPTLNILDVVRWFSTIDDQVKHLLDEAEPLFWLRHLTNQPGAPRFLWHISALVVEEYKRTVHANTMDPIPEDFPLSHITDNTNLQQTLTSPRSGTSYAASLRRESDDLISFEPLTKSRRESVGEESRKSLERLTRTWMSSPRSSLQGSYHKFTGNTYRGSTSPVSSLANLSGKLPRSRQQLSDEGSSSPANSELILKPRFLFTSEDGSQHEPVSATQAGADADALHLPLEPPRFLQDPFELDTPRPAKVILKESHDSLAPGLEDVEEFSVSDRHVEVAKRRYNSLPSTFSAGNQDPKTPSVISRSAEYQRKRKLLQDLKNQNSSIKSMMTKAFSTVDDYDKRQRDFAEKLHLHYEPIPAAIFDALIHDPSNVMGHTRRLEGWRAVDDTHSRCRKQRAIIRCYIQAHQSGLRGASAQPSGDGLLACPIATLSSLVGTLELEHDAMLAAVDATNERLRSVQELKDELKQEFESVERATSGNYPELAKLESLLDRYVNRRNQLWILAEKSLSLVLSSSAPFMKTFGRPIWDDIHDFLVIPWYRNHFSGEREWYPVDFPKRSGKHWVKLFAYATVAPSGLLGMARAVLALVRNQLLTWLPPLPWFLIYPIYMTVFFVFILTFSFFFLTVLGECAGILWWTAWFLRLVQ